MNQHEITERRPLLDASGNLTEPGYAKTLLPSTAAATSRPAKCASRNGTTTASTTGTLPSP